MKVLITGSTGRIGRYVLLHKPQEVEAELLLSPFSEQIPGFSWYRLDITDTSKIMMSVTCAEPDVVIHCAAVSDVDWCEQNPETAMKINRDGTCKIAQACNDCGAKMVLISTDFVFDGRFGPYSENDKTNPINFYGRTKLEGEHAALQSLDNLLIVRVAAAFGLRIEGSKHNYVSSMIEKLQTGNQVEAWIDQYNTPSYMDELAQVLWMLIHKDVTGVIHYGTSDRLSRYEMALHVCHIMGFPEKLVLPVRLADMKLHAKRPLETGFVTDKVHEILGVPPIMFDNALLHIKETLEAL